MLYGESASAGAVCTCQVTEGVDLARLGGNLLQATSGAILAADLRTEDLGKLFTAAAARKLVLPNFQREFVWSLEDQRGLGTSLLLEIPCGSMLFLSGTSADFSARQIGRRV